MRIGVLCLILGVNYEKTGKTMSFLRSVRCSRHGPDDYGCSSVGFSGGPVVNQINLTMAIFGATVACEWFLSF